jgi:hypothetical protein
MKVLDKKAYSCGACDLRETRYRYGRRPQRATPSVKLVVASGENSRYLKSSKGPGGGFSAVRGIK